MPSSNQPKVLLFDVGGVCVVSPFQAILDYELSHDIPPGWINHSISKTSPNGAWHKLERGELPLSPEFFTHFSTDLHNPLLWAPFYKQHLTKTQTNPTSSPTTIPPLPTINAEEVFWQMMSTSRTFDPWMAPALLRLRASKKYILAALSNTIIFPPSHPYSNPPASQDVRKFFDIFISSAHIGMRKPSPEIYEYTLEKINEFAKENGKGEVRAEDVVFLDDIGENLKAGKKAGFRTIKVHLGRTFEAVDELEDITGLELAGDHPRVPVVPVVKKGKEAKL